MATWSDNLKTLLIKNHGKEKASALADKFLTGLPPGYEDDNSVEVATSDLVAMDELSAHNPIKLIFTITPEREQPLHLRLLQWNKLIPLSTILPILENFAICTYKEHPYRILLNNKQDFIWISDYSISYAKTTIDLTKLQDLVQAAFINIYSGLAENDGLNKLIISAQLSWREVMIFRTYTKYLKQIAYRFSQSYIEKTLNEHSAIAKNLIALFHALHNPTQQ